MSHPTGTSADQGDCIRFDLRAPAQLHVLACSQATFLRCIQLLETMADWSLTSLKLKLVEIGAPVACLACGITFQLAEVVF